MVVPAGLADLPVRDPEADRNLCDRLRVRRIERVLPVVAEHGAVGVSEAENSLQPALRLRAVIRRGHHLIALAEGTAPMRFKAVRDVLLVRLSLRIYIVQVVPVGAPRAGVQLDQKIFRRFGSLPRLSDHHLRGRFRLPVRVSRTADRKQDQRHNKKGCQSPFSKILLHVFFLPLDFKVDFAYIEEPAARIASHQMMHRTSQPQSHRSGRVRRRRACVFPPRTHCRAAIDDTIIIAECGQKKCGKCPAPQSIFHKNFRALHPLRGAWETVLCNSIQNKGRLFGTPYFYSV